MEHTLSLYQLLIPGFALLMVGRGYSKWQHQQRSTREFITICVIWGVFSAMSLFPDFFLQRITTVTGVKNGIYAIIFFALMILTYAALVLYMKIEHLERDITDLVRRDAIEKMNKR